MNFAFLCGCPQQSSLGSSSWRSCWCPAASRSILLAPMHICSTPKDWSTSIAVWSATSLFFSPLFERVTVCQSRSVLPRQQRRVPEWSLNQEAQFLKAQKRQVRDLKQVRRRLRWQGCRWRPMISWKRYSGRFRWISIRDVQDQRSKRKFQDRHQDWNQGWAEGDEGDEKELEPIGGYRRKNKKWRACQAKKRHELHRLVGSCGRAVSTGVGLGSGTFARLPRLGQNWREVWLLRKIEVKGWVEDWSQRELTGSTQDQAMCQLNHLESILTEEIREALDWTYSEDNQGTWTKKTMINLWFNTAVGKGQMIQTLRDLRTNSGRAGLQGRRGERSVCNWTGPT